MRRPVWRRLRWLGPLVLFCAVLAAPVRAQEEQEEVQFQEPGITYKTAEKPYIQWLAGLVMVLAVVAVAFKNPHRTHLD
jgi:hypothetical protein